MREGVGSDGEKEEDVSERKGFRDGVDFHLGVIEQLTERRRERETCRKAPITINI